MTDDRAQSAEEIVRGLRGQIERINAAFDGYDPVETLEAMRKEAVEIVAKLSASQQRERAAVEDLKVSAHCKTCQKQCGLSESLSRRARGACKDYEWRGPQEAGEEQK